MGESMPKEIPYQIAQRIFREIGPGGGKKSLFDSKTYRRYALETCG
jgi:hypothetical protein